MKYLALATFLAIGAAAVTAMAPLPRKSPEFTIVEPSGKQTLLSSYKGKVVVLEFISTSCPHCQQNWGRAAFNPSAWHLTRPTMRLRSRTS
jgi:protein-disulfide isomerase